MCDPPESYSGERLDECGAEREWRGRGMLLAFDAVSANASGSTIQCLR